MTSIRETLRHRKVEANERDIYIKGRDRCE